MYVFEGFVSSSKTFDIKKSWCTQLFQIRNAWTLMSYNNFGYIRSSEALDIKESRWTQVDFVR